MKTIEELIASLEACTNHNCENCVYFNAHKDLTLGMNCDEYAIPEMQRDALHYLKKSKDWFDTMEALPDYWELLNYWDKNHDDYGFVKIAKSFFDEAE